MSDPHLSDEMIYEYLEGRLNPENSAEVERHRTICEPCSARWLMFERLFNDLENLPDMPLNKDFSDPVLKALRPSLTLPRTWGWALAGQIALTGVVLVLALPFLLQSEWFQTVGGLGEDLSSQLLNHWAALFGQGKEFLTGFTDPLAKLIDNLQNPNLSLSILPLIPVLIATGVLWLVGNGLLLREQGSGPK